MERLHCLLDVEIKSFLPDSLPLLSHIPVAWNSGTYSVCQSENVALAESQGKSVTEMLDSEGAPDILNQCSALCHDTEFQVNSLGAPALASSSAGICPG